MQEHRKLKHDSASQSEWVEQKNKKHEDPQAHIAEQYAKTKSNF